MLPCEAGVFSPSAPNLDHSPIWKHNSEMSENHDVLCLLVVCNATAFACKAYLNCPLPCCWRSRTDLSCSHRFGSLRLVVVALAAAEVAK